jgi:hypothetical protein
MLKRKLSMVRYIQTLIITLSIFALGVFLGFYISEIRIREMLSSYEYLRLKITGAILQANILEGELCKYDVLGITGKEKVELGRQVEEVENIRGKADKEVLRLKEDYSLLSINQLLLLKKWKNECNKNVSIILFFYSNINNATKSEEQGLVLNYIYAKYPNRVSTYAFDVDIDNPAVNVLKKKYDIRIVPTLVINEKVYPDFQSREKIEGLI